MASKPKTQNGDSDETVYQSLLKYLCKLEAENNTLQSKMLPDKINSFKEKLVPLLKGPELDNDYKAILKRREESFFNSTLLYRYQLSMIEKIYQTEIKMAEK
ncbi:hypothetical protein DSO57_1037483 [Entomophthora muscae]|uniref:Uncharacterized protein n=1 Tax=Entomophthora muscae TaxID=34485 RepID=A0ACC2TKQ0_9FUNG|nr:hypothetical protein DSO57_1037483 [Entomophthora muscae]